MNDTKECAFSCNEIDENYFSYKKVCYLTCPFGNSTVINGECKYMSLDNATSTEELIEMINDGAIYLYEEGPKGGFLYNAKNISAQIVGIDKNVNNYKNLIMKDNLTYIDFSGCINDIYSHNGLSEDDKLILVKYDVTNEESIKEAYFINPVEYYVLSYLPQNRVDL